MNLGTSIMPCEADPSKIFVGLKIQTWFHYKNVNFEALFSQETKLFSGTEKRK